MNKFMRKLMLLLIFVGFCLFGEEAKVSTGDGHEDDPQKSKSIEESEKILDARINLLNDRMKAHTKLFLTKIKVIPTKTVLTKGKAEGEDCKPAADQLAMENDCMILEVFDFLQSDEGKANLNYGSKSKYITIFFSGPNTQKDPREEKPRDITKIKSRIYLNDFKKDDIKAADVEDKAPKAIDNAQVTVFYQHDGIPSKKSQENNLSERGVGKYNLSNMENTKSNPSRNTFKQTYYIKHLDYFDKLFSSILDANDKNSSAKYKESNEVLKGSLKY